MNKKDIIESYKEWSGLPYGDLAHIDSDKMIEFTNYYHEAQLKKMMPSDEICPECKQKKKLQYCKECFDIYLSL